MRKNAKNLKKRLDNHVITWYNIIKGKEVRKWRSTGSGEITKLRKQKASLNSETGRES
jgi:hypothetical protein